MSNFNEANAVEPYLRDRLRGGVTHHTGAGRVLSCRLGHLSGPVGTTRQGREHSLTSIEESEKLRLLERRRSISCRRV